MDYVKACQVIYSTTTYMEKQDLPVFSHSNVRVGKRKKKHKDPEYRPITVPLSRSSEMKEVCYREGLWLESKPNRIPHWESNGLQKSSNLGDLDMGGIWQAQSCLICWRVSRSFQRDLTMILCRAASVPRNHALQVSYLFINTKYYESHPLSWLQNNFSKENSTHKHQKDK